MVQPKSQMAWRGLAANGKQIVWGESHRGKVVRPLG